jgi:ribosomal protein S18 acetylase RimI-like enzyme
MAEKEILIRQAAPDDLNSIVRFYTDYMFDSYLLKFGSAFINNYLKTILTSKDCITLIADDGRAVGFIMSTFDCKKTQARLIFNMGIFREWLKKVLRHPGAALESLGLVFYPFNTQVKGVNAELLFIAIEPSYRNQQLAAKLIKETLALMKQRGVRKVKVSTLVKNGPVNTLLNKMGFKINKTFRLFKKYMYLYVYGLD